MRVIVINPYELPETKEPETLSAWDEFAEHFRSQPGFINSTLHRALRPDARFRLINVAQWRSAEQFLAALNHPSVDRIAARRKDPDVRSFPSVYQIVRTI